MREGPGGRHSESKSQYMPGVFRERETRAGAGWDSGVRITQDLAGPRKGFGVYPE